VRGIPSAASPRTSRRRAGPSDDAAAPARDRALFVPVTQPLRGLFVGTLLVLVSSAVAIGGAVRGEPVLVVVGMGVLAVIFANEVLGRFWQAPLTVLVRWWRRRPRVMERERWLAQQREHQALVEPLIAGADFRSWKAFYDGDSRRRGKEVVLGEIDDGEFCWRVIWFPTTEVVAWPFRWRDERWHSTVIGHTVLRTPQPSTKTLAPAPVPEIIYSLGSAAGAEDGKRRISSASTLNDVRGALARA
jgi:hypothetical protein